ncbi:MAG: hypothetical protein HXS50_03200 [Theionarchaea archaeon]|nr:hypothetical protein [Theionarchaea archaeon]
MKIVVDAYAWVEMLRESEEGRSAVDKITDALEVYTPSKVMVEIAWK